MAEGTRGIVSRIEGTIGFIELDRRDRANAYVDAMLDAVRAHLQSLTAATDARVVVFASTSPGLFCSGADLDELGQREASDALSLKSLRLFDEIAVCPKPTIAAIDGPAVAGGLELALACDLRIASERARFAMPETSLGLIPAAGATFRLPRVTGEATAKQMILFGAELDAAQALACGLIHEVVDSNDLDARVAAWAQHGAERDPLAFELAKRAICLALPEGGGREFASCAQAVLYERRHGSNGEVT